MDGELAFEAGEAYFGRYGVLPTSVTWNATKAFEAGGVVYERYITGWAPRSEPTIWRPWPHPSSIARTFPDGGFEEYRSKLWKRIQERKLLRYQPIEPSADRKALAGIRPVLKNWNHPHRYPPEAIRPDVDAMPAPRDALRQVAILHDGPVNLPLTPIEERGVLALPGTCGTGKSAALWRVALNDVLAGTHHVVIVEDGRATITRQLFGTLFGPPEAGALEAADPDTVPYVVASDDAALRALEIAAVARVARRGANHPISLIVDDAEDVLPAVLDVALHLPRDLALSVAWTPLGVADDATLVRRATTLLAFRQDSVGMANVVSSKLNERHAA